MDYREVGVNTLMGGSSSLFGRGSSSSTQFYSFIQKKKKKGFNLFELSSTYLEIHSWLTSIFITYIYIYIY
jgi:hypothetical protein